MEVTQWGMSHRSSSKSLHLQVNKPDLDTQRSVAPAASAQGLGVPLASNPHAVQASKQASSGMDANELFTDADDTGAILAAMTGHGVTMPPQELDNLTYHQYTTTAEQQKTGLRFPAGGACQGRGVARGSRHLASSDHDLRGPHARGSRSPQDPMLSHTSSCGCCCRNVQ